ncbi:serine hydrolase domain-containing protein [Streptomyces monticola]|uniref:Serine hydrolase domain-containing protein n=1 Tax=Streptomyces monticola TaxID=2666263 RepID=A0ABW2JDW0_9ACTN
MSATVSTTTTTVSHQTHDRPELQKTIEELVETGFVGIQLRVNDERGEWVGSAGARELGQSGKALADGHFRIGSTTKNFIATSLLLLAAEGRIGLDTPAGDHLHWFGLDPRITVRMLLQHTSGIFNHTGEVNADGTLELGVSMPYGPEGKAWPANRFKTYQPEELVRLSLSRPARFEPGTDWSYANTNYVLARLVIEKVTGRSFAEELQRLILGPLGMTGTVAPGASPEIPEPYNHSYYRYEDAGQEKTLDISRQNPSWAAAGGDMISTTQDLHTYFSALMGGKLLPDGLLAEMRTPETKAGYGLGVFVQDLGPGGGTVFHHNGAMGGSVALMYSTADGSKTLTAGLTCVDDAELSIGAAFQSAQERLLGQVFGGGQTDATQPAG